MEAILLRTFSEPYHVSTKDLYPPATLLTVVLELVSWGVTLNLGIWLTYNGVAKCNLSDDCQMRVPFTGKLLYGLNMFDSTLAFYRIWNQYLHDPQ